MMEEKIYQGYLEILKNELVPAMGCTEPIAVAYAAALARKTLGTMPEHVLVKASANIIKNVKSVTVPNTGGQRGLVTAAVAGIVAGNADAQLEVLAKVTPEQIAQIAEAAKNLDCRVVASDKEYIFHIEIQLTGAGHTALVEIAGYHTNVIRINRDGQDIMTQDYTEEAEDHSHDILNVEQIIEFANCVKISDIQPIIQRQIDCNLAVAEEGLHRKWGAEIGHILLKSYGNSVQNRAKAYAAAASDARMSGCEMPVVINSGSGNQGLTASLPVIVYAKELNVSQEQLYRALVVSNLVTIHLKTGIGRLSAYCGATSAGCGAGAGIAYLYGGGYHEIAHTIVNAIAINSGMICDGAKASCAAKIASAVEAGLLGLQMQQHDSQFYGGDGIVVKGVENTILNVGELARVGMVRTDHTIINIMTRNPNTQN
jgi:L-cysteine desulfidase